MSLYEVRKLQIKDAKEQYYRKEHAEHERNIQFKNPNWNGVHVLVKEYNLAKEHEALKLTLFTFVCPKCKDPPLFLIWGNQFDSTVYCPKCGGVLIFNASRSIKEIMKMDFSNSIWIK